MLQNMHNLEDSFELLSTMSPKTNKQNCRITSKKVRKLALRRHFRQSLKLDKLQETQGNSSILLVDSGSTESVSCSSKNSNRVKRKTEIIVISDSDSEQDGKSDNVVLPASKYQEISNWISKINKEKVFKPDMEARKINPKVSKVNRKASKAEVSKLSTDISKLNTNIHNHRDMSPFSKSSDVNGERKTENLLKKTNLNIAVSSTLVNNKNHSAFDELFCKPKDLNDDVNSELSIENEIEKKKKLDTFFDGFYASLTTKKLIIQPDFARDHSSGENSISSVSVSNNSSLVIKDSSEERSDESDNKSEDFHKLRTEDAFEEVCENSCSEATPLRSVQVQREYEHMLDQLYGNTWRINREKVLSNTEPKPKNSNTNLAHNMKTGRITRTEKTNIRKSPWIGSNGDRLCDNVNTTKNIRTKLLFNDSASESEDEYGIHITDSNRSLELGERKAKTTSKGKKVINEKHNVHRLCDNLNTTKNIRTKLLSIDPASESEECGNNMTDSNRSLELGGRKAKTTSKGKNVIKETHNGKVLSDKENCGDSSESDERGKKVIKKKRNVKVLSDEENCGDSSESDDPYTSTSNERLKKPSHESKDVNDKFGALKDRTNYKIKVQTNLYTGFQEGMAEATRKKVIQYFASDSSSRSSLSSDEYDPYLDEKKWTNRQDKKLLHRDMGPLSFLASLSASVPDSRCDPSAKIFRNYYKTYKTELVQRLFKLYNERVFDMCIPADTPIEWNGRMRGTAGVCHCKKITRRTGVIERTVRLQLATKVLDSAVRLRDTLVHEMCHAATWIVNQIHDGHGPYWKAWASKAMKTFPELPPIKRCHNYEIQTKYTYKCGQCGYSFGRHTKSLDLERKRCGHCYGKFELLINKTTKNGTKTVPMTPKKEPTGFALFVKQNYAELKTPDLKHKDMMQLLSKKFTEMKT